MNLTIVSITFNNFGELESTYHSVDKYLNINDVDFFVVNGGSCEKTQKFLDEMKIHHVSESDDGISDAFNKGIQGALKENIIFLNSGDLLANGEYIQKAVSYLDQNLEADFVYSHIIFKDQYAGDIIIPPHENGLGKGMPYPHQSLIYRKSVFDRVGNFKLNYKVAMDFEHACRMHNHGLKGHYLKVDPPGIIMDGSGVSKTSEQRVFKENKHALIENNLYKENRLTFLKKLVFFKIRVILIKLGLVSFVRWIKHIKYKGR